MPEPIAWRAEMLLDLITSEVKESLNLDYKAGPALIPAGNKTADDVRSDLSKDVSAFANSDGGTLIYGIKEKNHLPDRLMGVDPVNVTREWLESTILGNIRPRLDGLRITQVDLGDGTVAYVVEVPQSARAPHMANDHRYYKRFDFQSVPMEHYEVEDVGRRQLAPDLRVSMHLEDGFDHEDASSFNQYKVRLHPVVFNLSSTPAEHSVIQVMLNKYLDVRMIGWSAPTEVKWKGTGQTFNLWSNSLVLGRNLPIWEGMLFKLGDAPMEVTFPVTLAEREHLIAWKTQAPGMAPKSGGYKLKLDYGSARLEEFDLTLD